MAARLQGFAAPNTVMISAATYRPVGGYFACEHFGSLTLKRVSQPMAVYQVLRESGAQSRLDVAARGGLTTLVGREPEVTLLLEHWARSKDGSGQVVFPSGEPGIGKPRLVEHLREHIGGREGMHIAFRCSPYHTNSALYPVIEHFKRLLRFQREDAPEIRLAKLEEGLRAYRFASETVLALFAELLSLPLPEGRSPSAHLSPSAAEAADVGSADGMGRGGSRATAGSRGVLGSCQTLPSAPGKSRGCRPLWTWH